MRNSLIALLLSLILHGLLFALFFLFELPKPKKERRLSAQSLKIAKSVDSPPLQGESQESIQTKNPPQIIENAPKKEESKKHEVKQTATKKESKKSPKPTKQAPKESAHKESTAPQKSAKIDSTPTIYDLSQKFENSDIKELYGDDFFVLSREEQKFIKDNLSKIGAITQRYLKYPQIAGELGQEGINALEFFLHPNGDISDLRLIHALGYTLLDKNSIKTIQIAYKDYPRPARTTKIRIKVHYKIYGR